MFRGRRPVGRPRLKWESNIRKHSSFLLKIRGWRRRGWDRDMWKANYRRGQGRMRVVVLLKRRRRRIIRRNI
jgi:hypothetical protein